MWDIKIVSVLHQAHRDYRGNLTPSVSRSLSQLYLSLLYMECVSIENYQFYYNRMVISMNLSMRTEPGHCSAVTLWHVPRHWADITRTRRRHISTVYGFLWVRFTGAPPAPSRLSPSNPSAPRSSPILLRLCQLTNFKLETGVRCARLQRRGTGWGPARYRFLTNGFYVLYKHKHP